MTHGSLFSGIGGFDLAAERCGWTNLFHCEWNPFAQQVLKYHFPKAKTYEDITKTDFTEWRGAVDVLSGGFPCQPFSVAGRRAGADDDRYLWPHMLRAIAEIRPTWVIGENVAGIVSMVQPGEEVKVGDNRSLFDPRDILRTEQEYVLETITKDLECQGYSVQVFLIPACAVGAPHRRDRIWIVAHADEMRRRERRRASAEPQRTESQGKWTQVQTYTERPCRESPATDTYGQGCEGGAGVRVQGGENEVRCEAIVRERTRSCKESYWEHFPTKPPVCGGDDGIPRELDAITFPKWRRESLKAYGNAIVPQVAHEIFKAIDKICN